MNKPIQSEKEVFDFFRLLQRGLKADNAPAIDAAFREQSWEHIFRLAAAHGVSAITWDTIRRLPRELQPPRELRLRWALTAETLEKRYRSQQQAAATLAAAFAQKGIRMLVLKGLGLSRDYPTPEHRECGDIDLYLFGKSDEGDRILQQLGAHLYFDVPKHSEYTWQGIQIENHRTILNVRRSKTDRELNGMLLGILGQEGTHDIGDNLSAPPATFNAIYLIRHAVVHYQKEGIAVRHLCDWACFLERHWPQIDHERFRAAMDTYGMDRFAALMTAAAVRYLGARVPVPDHDDAMLERFMREMLVIKPKPSGMLPKLYSKLFGPLQNRWRLRNVLRSSPWRYYCDTIRAQWNEKFTLFR